MKDLKIRRRFNRLKQTSYFHSLYAISGAEPTMKEILRYSRVRTSTLRLRRWYSISFTELKKRLRRLLGFKKREVPIEEIELNNMVAQASQGNHLVEDRQNWEEIDRVVYDIPIPDGWDVDTYLSNRNFNVLFSNSETIQDMIREQQHEAEDEEDEEDEEDNEGEVSLQKNVSGSDYKVDFGSLSGVSSYQ
ncbi:hypothetical protein ABW20_dc0107562 [Dactylellina cionopaga]|nr:hypothetical protein ABW20_dc0107562 [Dactylellina cionopaga]